MPFNFAPYLPPDLSNQAAGLLHSIETATTVLSAIQCGVACEDFVQRLIESNVMSGEEAARFNAIFDAALGVKFKSLAEDLRRT